MSNRRNTLIVIPEPRFRELVEEAENALAIIHTGYQRYGKVVHQLGACCIRDKVEPQHRPAA